MNYKIICFILLGIIPTILPAQFGLQDSLRGSITPERAWWDLSHYRLDIKVDPLDSTIIGTNTIQYKVIEAHDRIQIDMQHPMKITKVIQNDVSLEIEKKGAAHFISLRQPQIPGASNSLIVHYEGHPRISRMPPWVGGISWKKNQDKKDWVVSTCQGDGASLWWPCKDHMYDEVDSMDIIVTVPSHLINVSNGQLISSKENEEGNTTYHWKVVNPINNYCVNINIGDYAHFDELYQGENGPLQLDYYVMPYNLDKAKEHFKEVPRMMEAFEYWFGPYPFYEDGFKLVEVPYAGMEHQSSVTYGNGYKNGYLGRDPSFSGWGKKFDFIIVHESGHEWFANNITYKDIADMWIHEGFTAYSENLFLDYHFGVQASAEYVIGTRRNIQNDRPIIGNYNVNHSGSSDMYYKGANILHTLRSLVNDDDKWRAILRKINKVYYHQTVTTEEIENFLSTETGIDLQSFFDVYLRSTDIPKLEYSISKKKLKYRWTNCNKSFDMPVDVILDGKSHRLTPNADWQTKKFKDEPKSLDIDPNFYVYKKEN